MNASLTFRHDGKDVTVTIGTPISPNRPASACPCCPARHSHPAASPPTRANHPVCMTATHPVRLIWALVFPERGLIRQ
jgi:hypothetical protein